MIILYILFSTYIIYRLITFPFIRILKMQLEHEPNKKLDPISATTHNLTSFLCGNRRKWRISSKYKIIDICKCAWEATEMTRI